jgi:hypothetical protein
MSLWKSFSQLPGRSLKWLRYRTHRLYYAVLLSLSLPAIARWATLSWCTRSVFNTRLRWNGMLRYEMGRDAVSLKRSDALRAMTGGVLEDLLDRRLYLGRKARPNETWPDLRDVALRLARQIEQLRRDHPARPIILSPFHYVSQYAYVYVLEELRKALRLDTLSAVTGVPRDRYGVDATVMPHLVPLHTGEAIGRNSLGLNVVRALRRDGIVVLFADVPPFTMRKFPMETVDVSILGRPGRIHRGVFSIGAHMGALLLPFYLTFAQGRFDAHVFDAIPLASSDAPQQVADCISSALTSNYPHWLMAGYPSMYGFACAK